MADKLIELGEGRNAAPLHAYGEKLVPPEPLSWLEQIDRLMLTRLELATAFARWASSSEQR